MKLDDFLDEDEFKVKMIVDLLRDEHNLDVGVYIYNETQSTDQIDNSVFENDRLLRIPINGGNFIYFLNHDLLNSIRRVKHASVIADDIFRDYEEAVLNGDKSS